MLIMGEWRAMHIKQRQPTYLFTKRKLSNKTTFATRKLHQTGNQCAHSRISNHVANNIEICETDIWLSRYHQCLVWNCCIQSRELFSNVH
jgi:lambda repressor-like predicted transcriptional regulator